MFEHVCRYVQLVWAGDREFVLRSVILSMHLKERKRFEGTIEKIDERWEIRGKNEIESNSSERNILTCVQYLPSAVKNKTKCRQDLSTVISTEVTWSLTFSPEPGSPPPPS